MANDHAFGVVPTTDMMAGRTLRSTPVAALGGALNWLLAEARSKVKVWHKGVPDSYAAGIAAIPAATAATSMLAADLRIPTISSAHVSLHCRARVTVAGAGIGRIDFITRGTPDTLTLSSVAAGPVDLEGSVDFDVGADFDDLGIELQTQAGTTLVVHSVEVWFEPIADPIPAGLAFDDAQPFGVTSLGPDCPHDAGLNEALVDAVEHMRDSRRVLWCDAAIATAVGGDGKLRDSIHQTWATLDRGAGRRETGFVAWVNAARPSPPAAAAVYLLTGRPGAWPNAQHPIPITADGWKDYSFTVAEEGPVVQQMPVPSLGLGLWPAETGDEGQGRSTAYIYSVTVWEEPDGSGLPEVPPREGGQFLRPTVAEFLGLLANGANHLTFSRWLPMARYVAGWAGDVYRTKTFGRDDVHRIPIHPQPRTATSHIALIIYYQAGEALESVSDAAAAANGWEVMAVLKTYAGAGMDTGPAMGWTTTDGTLPTAIVVDNGGVAGGFPFVSGRYPVLAVTSGMQVDDSPTNPTRPRPLIVSNTNAGAELLVELETVNVRILAVDVWQMYEDGAA